MFEELQGKDLASVTFVRDYIQLSFDGPGLTLVVDPVVKSSAGEYRREDDGFCDALVSLINKKLRSCELEQDVSLKLVFASGESIFVPLDDKARESSPEAIIYYPSGNGVAQVW